MIMTVRHAPEHFNTSIYVHTKVVKELCRLYMSCPWHVFMPRSEAITRCHFTDFQSQLNSRETIIAICVMHKTHLEKKLFLKRWWVLTLCALSKLRGRLFSHLARISVKKCKILTGERILDRFRQLTNFWVTVSIYYNTLEFCQGRR